jgi:hypothetical protein
MVVNRTLDILQASSNPAPGTSQSMTSSTQPSPRSLPCRSPHVVDATAVKPHCHTGAGKPGNGAHPIRIATLPDDGVAAARLLTALPIAQPGP